MGTASCYSLSGRSLPISKVVFVNGGLDPWRPASVLQDLSPDATVINIDGKIPVVILDKGGYNVFVMVWIIKSSP